MNHQSKRTAAENRAIAPERREYVETHPCCLCGGVATDCHEIISGNPHRHFTKLHQRYWLAVCRLCHDKVQYEPKARQFARKIIADVVPALSERPGVYVEPGEVVQELVSLLPTEQMR